MSFEGNLFIILNVSLKRVFKFSNMYESLLFHTFYSTSFYLIYIFFLPLSFSFSITLSSSLFLSLLSNGRKIRSRSRVHGSPRGRAPFPTFPIMDSPRHASPLRRTRKLKLSLNDRSFIAGHRSSRRHTRSGQTP